MTDYGHVADVIEHLPALVRAERANRGITQHSAAAAMGLTPSLLNRLEMGHQNMTTPTMVALLRWLDNTSPAEHHAGVVHGIRHPGPGPINCPWCIDTLDQPVLIPLTPRST